MKLGNIELALWFLEECDTERIQGEDELGSWECSKEEVVKALNDALLETKELKKLLLELVDSPHFIDAATVPLGGIEVKPEQVVLEYSIGYIRVKQARKLLEELE